MEFTYRREGHRPFPEMLQAVEREIRLHGFGIVKIHDLQATLAAKGFEIQPLVVFDVVVPESSADICKMHVYAEGDVVWVSAIRPISTWSAPVPKHAPVAENADSSVVELIDSACA